MKPRPARSFATGHVMPLSWVDDYERIRRNERARETLRTLSERARAALSTDVDAVTIKLSIDDEPPPSRRRGRKTKKATNDEGEAAE